VAYWSTLPIKAVVSALREAGLEAWVSQSAGTFVCNYLFYGLMRTLAKTPTVRGGFIHVPYLPEQIENSLPSMRLEEIVRGLQIAIETSLATDRDLRAIGGATH
jgi:pyroglutamyl-peptidase